MDLDKLTSFLELFKKLDQKEKPSNNSNLEPFIGKYVLVRHFTHGVNVGYFKSYDNMTLTLNESRKLWRWQAKTSIALESVAFDGVKEGTRATHTVNAVIIPFNNLCGIITIDKDDVINQIKNYPVTEQD